MSNLSVLWIYDMGGGLWKEEGGGTRGAVYNQFYSSKSNPTSSLFHVYQDPQAVEISISRVICCKRGSNSSLSCLMESPVSLITKTNPPVRLHCWGAAVEASVIHRLPYSLTSQMSGGDFTLLDYLRFTQSIISAELHSRNEGSHCSSISPPCLFALVPLM